MPFYYLTRIFITAGTNLPISFKLLYGSPTYEISMQVLADANDAEKRKRMGHERQPRY